MNWELFTLTYEQLKWNLLAIKSDKSWKVKNRNYVNLPIRKITAYLQASEKWDMLEKGR